MFQLKIGRAIEIEVAHGGVYVRLGSKDFYWSRSEGLRGVE